MRLIIYIIKELGRIILKKTDKRHSDILRGFLLYKNTPPAG